MAIQQPLLEGTHSLEAAGALGTGHTCNVVSRDTRAVRHSICNAGKLPFPSFLSCLWFSTLCSDSFTHIMHICCRLP
jgi:hypothetical protein